MRPVSSASEQEIPRPLTVERVHAQEAETIIRFYLYESRCVRLGKLDCEDAPPRGSKEKTSPVQDLHDLLPLDDLHLSSSPLPVCPSDLRL